MAGFNGRELTLDWNATTLVGVRAKTISHTNDMVDVTTDDDNAWRTLLADPGLKSIEVTTSGITSDEVLIAEYYSATPGQPLVTNLPSDLATPGDLDGTFYLSGLELSGEHDGAYEFSATFMSSGVITYTASTA